MSSRSSRTISGKEGESQHTSAYCLLIDHRRKGAPFEAPIFQCLAMLTSSVGPMLTRQMHEVLDLMFPWGLSEALFHALEVIGGHIPPLLKTIQGESCTLSPFGRRS